MTRRSSASAACVFALCFAAAPHAQAADISADPILDLRLRGEYVDQDGLDDATALTIRGRFGYEVKLSGGWSALAEGEAVGHLNDDFSDTVENIPGTAVVADPETFELNRLQISWTGEKANATIGRQRIIFDDARFVGNVGFRQNEQTFDAVRVGYKAFDVVTLDYVYIDKVHRIFGDESPVGEFESNSHVIRLGAKTDIGEFAASVLLLDFQNAPAASSETYALRWSKSWKLKAGDLGMRAEFAHQSDYKGAGPNKSLGRQAYGVTFGRGAVTALAGLEILEGSGGQGFSTPLATLHAFQGWADVFLTTPAAGIRDISAGVKGKGPRLFTKAKPSSWAIIYHDFNSDNGAISYGTEIDAVFRMPINDWLAFEAKGAVFNGADGGPADRKKFWLALETSI